MMNCRDMCRRYLQNMEQCFIVKLRRWVNTSIHNCVVVDWCVRASARA